MVAKRPQATKFFGSNAICALWYHMIYIDLRMDQSYYDKFFACPECWAPFKVEDQYDLRTAKQQAAEDPSEAQELSMEIDMEQFPAAAEDCITVSTGDPLDRCNARVAKKAATVSRKLWRTSKQKGQI